MKPNEIIGTFAMIGMVAILVLGISTHFTILHLLGVGLFGAIQIMFLSWWGLTTFNEWVEEHIW